MPYTMTIDGPEEVVEAGINAFARYHGWQEEVPYVPEKGEEPDLTKTTMPNPVTAVQHIEKFFIEMIRKDVARQNALGAAEAARKAAEEQALAALDNTTLSLEKV